MFNFDVKALKCLVFYTNYLILKSPLPKKKKSSQFAAFKVKIYLVLHIMMSMKTNAHKISQWSKLFNFGCPGVIWLNCLLIAEGRQDLYF